MTLKIYFDFIIKPIVKFYLDSSPIHMYENRTLKRAFFVFDKACPLSVQCKTGSHTSRWTINEVEREERTVQKRIAMPVREM